MLKFLPFFYSSLLENNFHALIQQIMGNQSNFSTGYNTWICHRNQIKHQNQTKNTKQLKMNHVTANSRHQTSVTGQNSNIQNRSSVKQVKPLTPVNSSEMRRNIPSVITGSKIAPTSKIIQENQSKKSSIVQIIPQTSATEISGNKITSNNSIPCVPSTILLSNRENTKDKKIKFNSKIQIIDDFRVEIRETRNKIDFLANAQQKEYVWMLTEINNQKIRFVPDRDKLLYLLKQAKDYERLIVGLRKKRQEVVRILNDVNEQKFTESMKSIISEVNQYIDTVQKEFIRIDWRAVIMEASTNMQKYIDIICSAKLDSDVQRSFEQIINEAQAMRPPPPPPPKKQISNSRLGQNNNHSSVNQSQQQQLQNEKNNSSESFKLNKQVSESSLRRSNLGGSQQFSGVLSSKLRNSQISNFQKQQIRMSKINQQKAVDCNGLVVPSSSLLLNNTNNQAASDRRVQESNIRSTIDMSNLSRKQEKNPIPELSEIKNIKQMPQKKIVKQIVNGFQSTIKPPPSHQVFSMPQSLLK